jgi:hypothetical protein
MITSFFARHDLRTSHLAVEHILNPDETSSTLSILMGNNLSVNILLLQLDFFDPGRCSWELNMSSWAGNDPSVVKCFDRDFGLYFVTGRSEVCPPSGESIDPVIGQLCVNAIFTDAVAQYKQAIGRKNEPGRMAKKALQ